ncbi:MAG: hypothetical protein JWL90_1021 [Chthoniobacteraceae bacterium]|nr:hypothetical protein [Chthoniobacteraceae bacterium]
MIRRAVLPAERDWWSAFLRAEYAAKPIFNPAEHDKAAQEKAGKEDDCEGRQKIAKRNG